MEASRLSHFYRSISSWPKNEVELSLAAEKTRALLEAPVVFLWVPELGFRAAGVPNQDILADFIQAQIKNQAALNAGQNGFVRQVQISRESLVQKDGVALPHLALLPISAETRADSGPREMRERREFGWLVIAGEKPLSAKVEVLAMASSQFLSSLASAHQAEASLTLRDQFLSIASHELKTPLTSIYGILQLQERMLRPKPGTTSSPEQEKQRGFFKIVIRQVERLNELIDGLLDVSRIQNGRFIVEPSESDVVALTRETVASRLTVIAQEAGVRIQVDAPETFNAWIDPVRFEEVVTNLGMNAIRFSPEGGVVWIRLRAEGEAFVLSVRDQGPSVPESDRNRIFQPFERAQRTSRLGGLGLGLFISRQIAQLHGGNVVLAESIPSKGNLFEARFPMRNIKRQIA